MSRRLRTSVFALVLMASFSACSAFAGAEKSSPTQLAIGLKGHVPLASTEAGDLFAVGGVQRQWFEGGHDLVLTLGLQGRRALNDDGTWVGAEATYNNWRVSDGFQDPVAHVVGVSGLAGRPIRNGVSVWGSAGILSFGNFTANGSTAYEGGTGWQVNVGIELAASLLNGN